MIDQKYDTISVEVPAGELRYFHIYEPDHFVDFSKYLIVFPIDLLVDPLPLTTDLRHIHNMADKHDIALAKASSKFRPEVTALYLNGHGATDQLIIELQRLDAKNVSRDRVFKDRRTTLLLRPYELKRLHTLRLSLLSVTVYL